MVRERIRRSAKAWIPAFAAMTMKAKEAGKGGSSENRSRAVASAMMGHRFQSHGEDWFLRRSERGTAGKKNKASPLFIRKSDKLEPDICSTIIVAAIVSGSNEYSSCLKESFHVVQQMV
jgi:hypothetical protein